MINQFQFRVLVVEDDPNWNNALCDMYKDILAELSPFVLPVMSGKEALALIESGEKFNLLSLDINLGKTHPKTPEGWPDLTKEGAEGRPVLRRAIEKKACKAVVVITQLPEDKTLNLVIPDENERRIAKMTLPAYLNELFPGRSLYLSKSREIPIEENINIIKEQLTLNRLLDFCKALNKFYKEGQYWCIRFEGKTIQLKDNLGLRYIAYLLNHQSEEVHCTELISVVHKSNTQSRLVYRQMSKDQIAENGLKVSGLGDAGEIIDTKAKAEYKSRLREIEKELEEVKKFNDLARIEVLEREKEFLSRELSRAYGLRGQVRKAGDPNKRARQAVSHAIHRTLKIIRKHHQELWNHLKDTLHIGNFCNYSPHFPTHWSL